MSDVSQLTTRIDGVIAAVKDKVKQEQRAILQDHLARQQRLKDYLAIQAKIIEIAKPRLQQMVARFGERVSVAPSVTETTRAARFEFRSRAAYITLTFSVVPDMGVKNAIIEYNLQIVPVLWKFKSHAEYSTPITGVDAAALTKWVDDRIVEFVELYIQINESELCEKAEYVEDPIGNVKFPKFAAGATLEHGGQTYYFIDTSTKMEFAKQKGIACA